jgi:hypothetical protein
MTGRSGLSDGTDGGCRVLTDPLAELMTEDGGRVGAAPGCGYEMGTG